jgi:hypothetical protein
VNRLDVHVGQEITIPRSAWVARVLPQIGYGTVHLLELPAIPMTAVEHYKEAYQALVRAQEHHRQGLYDEAAASCRVALERFFDYPEVTGADQLTRKVPTLKKSWETKLGKATYDWLNSSLDREPVTVIPWIWPTVWGTANPMPVNNSSISLPVSPELVSPRMPQRPRRALSEKVGTGFAIESVDSCHC